MAELIDKKHGLFNDISNGGLDLQGFRHHLFTHPQTCQNQCGRVDFGNHSSTKTCQIFGTIYSINFQSLIGVHCSAHRLELCYKDAMKKVPMAEKVLTLLTGLYYMY